MDDFKMSPRLHQAYDYRQGKWKPRQKSPVEIEEGGDIAEAWEAAGYKHFISYGGAPSVSLPVLEIWRLEDEEKDPQHEKPLFIVHLQIDDNFHEVCLDSIPDLIIFCSEVKPYVSMMSAEVLRG